MGYILGLFAIAVAIYWLYNLIYWWMWTQNPAKRSEQKPTVPQPNRPRYLAKWLRDDIRLAVAFGRKPFTDEELLQVMEESYISLKEKLSMPLSREEMKDHGMNLFITSVTLFVFGRLEMAEDMVASYPFLGLGHIRHWAAALNTLLPPGAKLYRFIETKDPVGVRDWIAQNRDRLRWNEGEEKFEWIEGEEDRKAGSGDDRIHPDDFAV